MSMSLASACIVMLERYDDRALLNVGTGEDVTIRELAERVATLSGTQETCSGIPRSLTGPHANSST